MIVAQKLSLADVEAAGGKVFDAYEILGSRRVCLRTFTLFLAFAILRFVSCVSLEFGCGRKRKCRVDIKFLVLVMKE